MSSKTKLAESQKMQEHPPRQLLTNLKKSTRILCLIMRLKSKSLSHKMLTCSICYLADPQRRKAKPNKTIKIRVKIPHDSRLTVIEVINPVLQGMAEGNMKICRLTTLISTFRKASNIVLPAAYHSNCIQTLTIVM